MKVHIGHFGFVFWKNKCIIVCTSSCPYHISASISGLHIAHDRLCWRLHQSPWLKAGPIHSQIYSENLSALYWYMELEFWRKPFCSVFKCLFQVPKCEHCQKSHVKHLIYDWTLYFLKCIFFIVFIAKYFRDKSGLICYRMCTIYED